MDFQKERLEETKKKERNKEVRRERKKKGRKKEVRTRACYWSAWPTCIASFTQLPGPQHCWQCAPELSRDQTCARSRSKCADATQLERRSDRRRAARIFSPPPVRCSAVCVVVLCHTVIYLSCMDKCSWVVFTAKCLSRIVSLEMWHCAV